MSEVEGAGGGDGSDKCWPCLCDNVVAMRTSKRDYFYRNGLENFLFRQNFRIKLIKSCSLSFRLSHSIGRCLAEHRELTPPAPLASLNVSHISSSSLDGSGCSPYKDSGWFLAGLGEAKRNVKRILSENHLCRRFMHVYSYTNAARIKAKALTII